VEKYELKFNFRRFDIVESKLEREKNAARRNLLNFTKYTNSNYDVNWHHKLFAKKLDLFMKGKIKRLMVFMPPQHGKSELCSRRLPAMMLGKDPNLRIALTSYNHDFASKLNRDVQKIMTTKEYAELFPDTCLTNGKNGLYVRNADEFEVMDCKGGLVSVGVCGGLTGRSVDIGIIDDIYKDAKDAWSPTVRQNVADWYDTVFKTRLHNKSRQLITLTRWHPDDLAGMLLKREGEDWEIVVLPALKTAENTCLGDNREIGEALWETRHSKKSLEKLKIRNEFVFETLYQQNPKPSEGMMFNTEQLRRFNLDDIENVKSDGIIGACDIADTGRDYLCLVIGKIIGNDCYITDVLFTKKPVEITQPLVCGMLDRTKTDICTFESNGAGRIYALNVRKSINGLTQIKWKTSTLNKHTRILMKSGVVKNNFVFRQDYAKNSEYAVFMDFLCNYRIEPENNAFDDAPDAVCMLADLFSGNFNKSEMVDLQIF